MLYAAFTISVCQLDTPRVAEVVKFFGISWGLEIVHRQMLSGIPNGSNGQEPQGQIMLKNEPTERSL